MLHVNHLIGFGSFSAASSEVLVDRTTGSNIGDMTDGASIGNAFDGTTSQALSGGGGACPYRGSANGYIGKDFSGPGAKRFSRFKVYGSNDAGFVFGANPSTTIVIYAKNGAPASGTDGTQIGTTGSFTDTADESAGREITSTDTSTSYTHVWAYVNDSGNPGAARSTCIAEIEMWELV